MEPALGRAIRASQLCLLVPVPMLTPAVSFEAEKTPLLDSTKKKIIEYCAKFIIMPDYSHGL